MSGARQGIGGAPAAWADAILSAALFAINPSAIGGIVLHAAPGPVRDAWLAAVVALLQPATPVQRIPLHITADRLLGGIDFAATLATGRRVLAHGVLAGADRGVAIVAMAERWSARVAASISIALDSGEVIVERDGLQARTSSRFGLIALDEGTQEDPRPPGAWMDRLAFHIDLESIGCHDMSEPPPPVALIDLARERLRVLPPTDAGVITALCIAALRFGITSLRAAQLAVKVARLHAALVGRPTVAEADAVVAARLVFAPRATMIPTSADDPAPPARAPPPPDTEDGSAGADDASAPDGTAGDAALEDRIIAAALAALPDGLLKSLGLATVPVPGGATDGQAGAQRTAAKRGRATGTQPLAQGRDARLNILATLRAAAPWQRLRAPAHWQGARVRIRREDFRATRYKHQSGSTIVFAVDASGSSALHRLAEAKGAVELLLAECYARRDRVALVAFRGTGAELLLPQSRSLVRAKRCLAGLPGGGGTPLAAGIEAAGTLAASVRRAGDTPLIVLMTDGRANVTRSGTAGRPEAREQAVAAARAVRAAAIGSLLIDTSPQPNAFAASLAAEMGGRYIALPHADADTISSAIQEERVSLQR